MTRRDARRRRAPGFTLVELIVAMALVAILSTLAAPGFSSMLQNWRLRGATESLSMGLQTARTEAIRRNTRVQLELAEGSWTVRETPAAGSSVVPPPIDSRSVQDAGGAAVLAVSPASKTIVFNNRGAVEGGVAERFSISAPKAKCIADGGNARCLDITVAAGGQIRMCDPGLTNKSDTRFCPR
jgi:type IV fimbrial biogenesis protein FimT